MILSYRAGRYGHLDTINTKICQLFQILDTETGWCKKKWEGGAGAAAGAAGGMESISIE